MRCLDPQADIEMLEASRDRHSAVAWLMRGERQVFLRKLEDSFSNADPDFAD